MSPLGNFEERLALLESAVFAEPDPEPPAIGDIVSMASIRQGIGKVIDDLPHAFLVLEFATGDVWTVDELDVEIVSRSAAT